MNASGNTFVGGDVMATSSESEQRFWFSWSFVAQQARMFAILRRLSAMHTSLNSAFVF
jgi:hypothetical protein